jgi:hypothetical protein
VWRRTVCGEVVEPYPGKPSCSDAEESPAGIRKPEPQKTQRCPGGEGAEGGRFAYNTFDARPEKPGNSVEEKISRTGRGRAYGDPGNGEPAIDDGKHTSEPAKTYVSTTSEGQLGNIVVSGCGKTRTKDEDGDTGESP